MTEISDRHIAVITTGGTIGAAFGAGMTVLKHQSTVLRDQLTTLSQKKGIELHTYAALDIFSEDMQPSDWGVILRTIEATLAKGYKRIMVTHGTDTMEYSVTAAGLYFGNRDACICFTGAFLPPSAPQSDAALNIEATVAFLMNDEMMPGVYLAFSQTSNGATLIRAQDLMPMASDQTFFRALYGENVSYYAAAHSGESLEPLIFKKASTTPLLAPGVPPTPEQFHNQSALIIPLTCYPGIDLEILRLDPLKPTLLILGAYHSGTVPTIALRDKLSGLAITHPKLKTVAAMHPARYVKSPYETTAHLTKHGQLTIYRDIQPHQIYVLATCEAAKGLSLENILDLLAPWRFDGPAII